MVFAGLLLDAAKAIIRARTMDSATAVVLVLGMAAAQAISPTLSLSLSGTDLVNFKTRVKNFYDRYSDRRSALERNHLNAATALGHGPNQ